jgi:hypothetical protein
MNTVNNNRVCRPKRILLGQLNSNGDCLYATTIARQIKKDFPGCHLTWAIGSMCRSMIDGNPDVDEVWEVPLKNIGEVGEVWRKFEQEAWEKQKRGVFDEVFFTQIINDNLHNYDGMIRSSIFRNYPHEITVPVAPVLRLSLREIENVRRFAESHHLRERTHVILFETSPQSGQSFLTFDFAMEVANRIIAKIPNSCVILSSKQSFASHSELIIDGSALSLRENAELSNYCSLLIGGSSGISWICTSDWAKWLPMIQLLKSDAVYFNSLVKDHERWGIPTDKIIEMKDCSIDNVYQCLSIALLEGFDKAKDCYHEHIRMPFAYYQPFIYGLLKNGKYKNLSKFCLLNIKQNGVSPQLILGFLKALFLIMTSHAKRAILFVLGARRQKFSRKN